MISRTLPSTRAAHRLVVRLMGLAIVGWSLGACDAGSPTADAPEPTPTTGALTVGVVTTGTDLGDSYVLSLDGQEQTVTPNQSLSFSELAPGPHVVELRDEDYNCRVMEQPEEPVLIAAGETASADFAVVCRTKQVAFISGRDGSFDLYLASVSGDELTHFLSLPQSKEDEPAWSPDGIRLAVATDVGGDFDIYSVSLTGHMENLTRNPAAIEGMPTWSPDGAQIAYRSYQNGNDDIWVMNADGSGQRPLIASPAREILPQWSPDGQSIAYVSDDDGSDDVWVYHITTATYARLTPQDDIADTWPSWSPDGEHIAFASNRDGNNEVYVMAADGSNPVNLTQASDSNEWLPAWSPDGKYISFNTDRHGDLDIYWMKADGSRVQPVTTAPGHDFFLTWNPVPWPL